MLDGLQVAILKRIAPRERQLFEDAYSGKSKLRTLLGASFLQEIRGKTVIDFGCGEGAEAVEMASLGAEVIGLDIRERMLELGRSRADAAGLSRCCEFAAQCTRKADIVVSIDAFEHFEDPAAILQTMFDLLKPGGALVASFGPTWYHPLGGHLVSVFPWAHLIFSEAALMQWRSGVRSDGARRFSEVEGGLNQMTIRRFEQLARASPFTVERIKVTPIRKLRWLHCRWSREWTSAMVLARMRKP
jgi:SAM-dependent methyltransferase